MSLPEFSPAAVVTNATRTPTVAAALPFNPLEHPIALAVPRRLTPYSAWHEHIPFAMYLVSRLKPKVIVELGTSGGDSYCAFCQAVQELNLNTRCYAFDTWQGDAHSGYYGPEVLQELRAFHDPLYGTFSQLVQSSFADALEYFADGSIDLLHLDGYHTYEVARADLLPWLVELSPRGVILLHDVNVREREFGVWRLWEELAPHYPHWEFYHGHGLGVMAVGPLAAQGLGDLINASSQQAQLIRTFFFRLGQGLERASGGEAQQIENLSEELRAHALANNDLTAQLATKQELVERVTREAEAQKNWAAQLGAHNTELEQRVRTLMADKDTAQQERANEQRGAQDRIATLQQMLDEQTQHLDTLTAGMERMTTRETSLRTLYLGAQAELMDRDRELDRLTAATAPLSQQNAALAFLNSEIENLKHILAARDEGITWLRAELDAAQAQIRAMEDSRVWRLRNRYRLTRERVGTLFGASPRGK